MTNKSVNKFSKAFIIPTSILIPLTLWYRFAESYFERLLILFIVATTLIPLALNLLAITVSMSVKPIPKEQREAKNVINNTQVHKTNIKKEQSKKKPTKVNPSEYYIPTRDAIIACVKNKIFDRQDILTLLGSIDGRLGSHKQIYDNNFKFENDMHSIYCRLKSSVLKDDDYIYLLNLINSLVEAKNIKEEII